MRLRSLPEQSEKWALVTAGGTTVKLDPVRKLGNTAEGDFGVAKAIALHRRGFRVVLLVSRVGFLKFATQFPQGMVVETFDAYDQYAAKLNELATRYRFDLAFSSAAVSDFGPAVESKGKMSSRGKNAPTIKLAKLPKVLATWRQLFGQTCYVVGYKYLTRSNSSKAALFAAARRQNAEGHLNATVANFAEEIGRGQHPVWLVTAAGGTHRLEGSRETVAESIVDFAIEQADTTWATSLRVNGPAEAVEPEARALRLAQRLGVFRGSEGNVAVFDHRATVVTPRAVDKRHVKPGDLVHAQLHRNEGRCVIGFMAREGQKPSIDTHVYCLLGKRVGEPLVAIHFHDGFVLRSDAVTRKSFPCGTAEQAGVILEAFARLHEARGSVVPKGRMMMELVAHGHTLFLARDGDGLAEIAREWRAALGAYRAHLVEMGQGHRARELRFAPLFDGARIVGVAATHKKDGWTSFFLIPEERGGGLGDRIVRLCNERDQRVGVHANCQAVAYYLQRGFQAVDETDGLTVLIPPSLRGDVRNSATIRLRCARTGRVALLRRPAGTRVNPGHWSNPGGGVESSETPWQAAVRETHEELGIDLSMYPEPANPIVRFTGSNGLANRVTCFPLEVLNEVDLVPAAGEADDARWFNPIEAAELPMGQATRSVLRATVPDF